MWPGPDYTLILVDTPNDDDSDQVGCLDHPIECIIGYSRSCFLLSKLILKDLNNNNNSIDSFDVNTNIGSDKNSESNIQHIEKPSREKWSDS